MLPTLQQLLVLSFCGVGTHTRHKRFAAATRSNISRTSAVGDFRSATLACCQQTSFVC